MFSIIICCFNSSTRITKTLEAISNLKTEGFTYDVIIVDNNSFDDTAQIAVDIWRKIGVDHKIKIIFEETPGQTFARKKGVLHSSGEYILFCDDDNWLKDDYLIQAKRILQDKENIGALGGWSEGVFEIKPPEWFYQIANSYAVGGKPDEKLVETNYIWGAGMIIKGDIAKKIFTQNFVNSGRSGTTLTSGDDVEICNKLTLLNYKIYKSRDLYFQHFITKDRINWSYVKKLHIGFGYSATEASFSNYNNSFKYMLLQFKSIILDIIRHPFVFIQFIFQVEGKVKTLRFYSFRGNLKYLLKRS